MCKSDISVPLKIENEDCLMQLDTGCALSPSPLIVLKQVCPEAKVKPTRVVLSKYTGETLHPLREVHVKVEYMGSQDTLPLVKELRLYLIGTGCQISIWIGRPCLKETGP